MELNISWHEVHSIVNGLAESFDDTWRQRTRKIGTSFLVVFLMRICCSRAQSGYQIIIDEIWESLKKANIKLPQERPFAASSVCEARSKLDANVIHEMNRQIADSFLSLNHELFRWNGFRLFVVDGSTVHLPPELKKEGFGGMNPEMHYPQGKLSVLMHVGSSVAVDVILDSKGNERDLAAKHLEVLLPGEDVVVYDRGYFSYELALTHVQYGIDAIFRLPLAGCTKVIQEFIDDPEKPMDKVVFIAPTKEKKAEIRKRRRGFLFAPCRLRLIRYFVNGNEYILATTIQEKEIIASEFGDVYHERWNVEEHFKVCKTFLSIESFHAKTLNGVLQELYAAELLHTLTRLVAVETEDMLSTSMSKKSSRSHFLQFAVKVFARLKPKQSVLRSYRRRRLNQKSIK